MGDSTKKNTIMAILLHVSASFGHPQGGNQHRKLWYKLVFHCV